MTDQAMGPRREKYWSELDSDGRIERMRQEVKNLQRINDHQLNIIQKLLAHQHDDTGGLVVKLNEYGFLGRANVEQWAKSSEVVTKFVSKDIWTTQ